MAAGYRDSTAHGPAPPATARAPHGPWRECARRARSIPAGLGAVPPPPARCAPAPDRTGEWGTRSRVRYSILHLHAPRGLPKTTQGPARSLAWLPAVHPPREYVAWHWPGRGSAGARAFPTLRTGAVVPGYREDAGHSAMRSVAPRAPSRCSSPPGSDAP